MLKLLLPAAATILAASAPVVVLVPTAVPVDSWAVAAPELTAPPAVALQGT